MRMTHSFLIFESAQHRLQRTGGLHPPEEMLRDNWLDKPHEPCPVRPPLSHTVRQPHNMDSVRLRCDLIIISLS